MNANITGSKKRWDFLVVLKFLACLLITNSHCREIYPLQYLAVGGSHGNGLFFIVSGFLLANVSLDFVAWMKKRVVRLLPVTLFFIIINLLVVQGIGRIQSLDLFSVIWLMINEYWFVFALILFCPFYYLMVKYLSNKRGCVMGIFALCYALLYLFCLDKSSFAVELEGFWYFKVFSYFGIFLLGGFLRKAFDEGNIQSETKKRWPYLALVAAFTIIWAGEYALVVVFQRGLFVQFLIHIGVWGSSIFLFLYAATFSEKQLPLSVLSELIKCIADSTLEIYLLQVTVLRYIVPLAFPLNWFVFWITALGGGILLHKAFEFIRRKKT